jgi:peptidoglycan-associated lipoprotein
MVRRLIVVAALFLMVVALAGGSCPQKPPPPPPDVARSTSGTGTGGDTGDVTREIDSEPFARDVVERDEVAEKPTGTAAELNRQGVLQVVYFEFDSTELSDRARETLQRNADWLVRNPTWAVAIGGHCDERGTIEYNIALGDRRARTVRDYLGSLGVAAARMRVVSYGEERPAVPGHDETAWARNRRAEFVLED